jgi:hypothetical protein
MKSIYDYSPQKRPPKTKLPARTCAARGCTNRFIPKRVDQVNCSPVCNNREKQRRLRARARIGIGNYRGKP